MRRAEYPRPQFYRSDWQNLNGKWQFAFDDDFKGHNQIFTQKLPLEIEVPFCYQSDESGIGDESIHDHIWYKKNVVLEHKDHKGRVLLHIGASDYYTEVYINHHLVGKHEGGHTSFTFDITDSLNREQEEILIYVNDESTNSSLPRGKQYWKPKPESIWYGRTTGIWQTVWLEFVPDHYLVSVQTTPLYDQKQIQFDFKMNQAFHGTLEVDVIDQNESIASKVESMNDLSKTVIIDLDEVDLNKKSWSPENPYLFDVLFRVVKDNETIDCVKSYFGMRKVSFENGKFYLNNKEYYQKLILDQGYYPGSLLTAKSDEDLIKDITLAKQMGFNGCRKHQKVEEDRFFYHADKLGYLVWGEMANAYTFSKKYVSRITKEWTKAIKQNYNHPSIVVWVPLNESWGIRSVSKSLVQQEHQLAMYELTKSLDPSRLVSSNDGWEMMKTDICGIHNYMHGRVNNAKQMEHFRKVLSTKENILKYPSTKRPIYVKGFKNVGEPIMLTEFGGISFNGGSIGWGYTSVSDGEAFLKEYERLIKDIKASECIVGFCYTQLTDVYQETNGLLKFDRTAKVDLNKIKEINDMI